jgi:hypothetical protein
MGAEKVAPCRHAGVAPEEVIERSIKAIQNLHSVPGYLAANGLSVAEYQAALPIAIQRLRGSAAAKNSERRQYLKDILNAMLERGFISSLQEPKYGQDTIYRVEIPNFGSVAIIQKGCPDGKHSSNAWTVPDWARESYVWWLCPSVRYVPGVHINKGVTRMTPRFLSDKKDVNKKMLDGVIFNNEVCGTPNRPCPKSDLAISIGGSVVVPPCIYILPERESLESKRSAVFPSLLLSLFGIEGAKGDDYIGRISFHEKGSEVVKKISLSFGAGKSTIYRG